MQFVCNNCKAKYTISAERVQGRVLKIRCRECGEIIEVRGDGLATGELLGDGAGRKRAQSSKDLSESYKMSKLRDRFKESFTAKGTGKLPDTDSPEPPPPQRETRDPKRWYVAVRNQPVGPVSKTKVKSYLRRKEVDGHSLVWREGFDDWKPLKDCEELSDLLTPAPPPPAEEAAPPAPPPPGPAEPAGGGFEEEPPTEGDALRGFHVGRIDAQATVAEMAEAGEALEHDVFRPVPQAERPQRTRLQRILHSRVTLLAGGALAVLIGFGVTLIVVGAGRDETPEPVETPEVVHDEGMAEDHSERGDILAGLTISLEEVITEELQAEKEAESDEPSSDRKGPGDRPKPRKGSSAGDDDDDDEKKNLPNMPLGIKEKTVSASGTSVGGKGKGGAKGQNGLSDTQIRSVVTKNSKVIRKCYEKVLGKGIGVKEDIKVKVRVNVGASGMVTKVKVVQISKYGNFLTPCIEKGIKSWVFPRADRPSEFLFPILLTPKN
jgi:predicted Zn finger-like uncharacterized protein